jgi:MFS family permease
LSWRAIFLVNLPLGALALYLAHRHLPVDRRVARSERLGFDHLGTALLVLTLGANTLAVSFGSGSFGLLYVALLVGAALGLGLFAFAETRVRSPLVRLRLLRDPLLSAGLWMSGLVSTVMMATLVVGPFYLSGALGLGAAVVGLVMTIGPAVAAATGVPAGRVADRVGAQRMIVAGLIAIGAGSLALAALPTAFGVPGYVAPIVVITGGYAIFQTANNASVMGDVRSDQRGLVSGMLNLSRNLGLITGASLMGAVFALASGASEINGAQPDAVVTGMRITFLVAAVLILFALAAKALAGRSHATEWSAREVAGTRRYGEDRTRAV